jgi:hypothetical protein
MLIEANAGADAGERDDHGGRRHDAVVPRAPPSLAGDDPPEDLGSRVGSPAVVKNAGEIEIVHHYLQSNEHQDSRIRKMP